MRKPDGDTPYYNISELYIRGEIENYLSCDMDLFSNDPLDENVVLTEREVKCDPSDNEYGGFWYKKGRRSQEPLIQFYEKFGFYESPSVHLNWGCFSEIPFPTMRLELTSSKSHQCNL